MFQKINKKIFFRTSIIVSGFLTLIAGSKIDNGLVGGLIDSIPPITSLAKIEKAYGDGGGCGDCCGSGCENVSGVFEVVMPTPTASRVFLFFSSPDLTVTTNAVVRPIIPTCFIAGTEVMMFDGSVKNIEEVKVGESLLASNGSNTVNEVFVIPHKGDIFAFNDSENYFFTAGHPFMTSSGWKSMDPEMSQVENPGLEVGQMVVGDTLVKINGQTEVIESIKKQQAETTVYNFRVSGDNSFYADRYLVHNATLKK